MRALTIIIATLWSAAASAASVTFISPLEGAQVIGPTLLEITTTARGVDRVEFYVDGVLAGVARKPPYRIGFDMGDQLQSRQIVAKVVSNGFRDVTEARVTTAALTAGESIAVDLVEVPLRVRSSKTLKAADLRVRENSVQQTIREVTPVRAPAHFAFVVDRSLSMGGGKLEAALRAVDDGVRMLRPGDTASLVLFNHNVSNARGISTSSRAADAIADTVPSGGTSLRDALTSLATTRRTYTIVITDGSDRNSATTEENALRHVSNTKTTVSAIAFGSSSGFLQRATRNTGGTLKTATAVTVRQAVRDIIADLNSRYTLVYQSAGTKRGWRTVDVAAQRRGVEIVSARKGYFAE